MTEIVVEEECGNSPKKQFVREFYVALADSDVDELLSRLTDDVQWTIVGELSLDGKQAVAGFLEQMLSADYAEIKVETIITHGYDASANGTTTSADGDTHAFCEVFTSTVLQAAPTSRRSTPTSSSWTDRVARYQFDQTGTGW